MRIKIKKVYYCDFCSKRALRSLAEHEKHCTANPDRQCRLCAEEGNPPIRPIIDKYKGFFRLEKAKDDWGLDTIKVIFIKDFTLDDIQKKLNCKCPNCTLSIIRCLRLNRYYFEKKFEFDYKKELESWWKKVEEEQLRDY